MDSTSIKLADNPWIKYIKRRVYQQNKNFLCIITGQTGSGKSWAALRMAEELDPNFSMKQVIFKGSDLMKLIINKEIEQGSVIIWDEAGVNLGSRAWQSKTNRVINLLLQTFRHRNFILFFTVPDNDFIDSQSRRMFHAQFEMDGINHQKQKSIIKPLSLQFNSELKKTYRKYLRVDSGGGFVPLKRWAIPKPSDTTIEEYEEKKLEFTHDLNHSIREVLEQEEKNEFGNFLMQEKGDEYPELSQREYYVVTCWKEGTFKNKDIAIQLAITPRQVADHISALRKKGYLRDKFRAEWVAQQRELIPKENAEYCLEKLRDHITSAPTTPPSGSPQEEREQFTDDKNEKKKEEINKKVVQIVYPTSAFMPVQG